MAKNESKPQGRGKRYSTKEKAEILTFVDKHNAEKGRGGAAAASRQFKVSQLTIGNWLKEAGSPSPRRKKGATDITKVLKRLGEIHKKMAKVEEELDGLRKEYASLKSQL
jgi:transposase-like protein